MISCELVFCYFNICTLRYDPPKHRLELALQLYRTDHLNSADPAHQLQKILKKRRKSTAALQPQPIFLVWATCINWEINTWHYEGKMLYCLSVKTVHFQWPHQGMIPMLLLSVLEICKLGKSLIQHTSSYASSWQFFLIQFWPPWFTPSSYYVTARPWFEAVPPMRPTLRPSILSHKENPFQFEVLEHLN